MAVYRESGTAKIYAVLPIISGTLKAMNFKFGRTFTGSLRAKGHTNFGDKGAWAYPGIAQFFAYPLLAQERLKL